MHRLLVAFTTYDGHTAKMAERIASSLREDDCADEVCDLARLRPERPVHEYDGVIGGGPLHGSKHHRQLVRFAAQNCVALNEQPSAIFLVRLSAAGNVEQQSDATRCLNELLDETGWKPSATAIVAGALLYRKDSIFRRCCGVLFRRNANPADAQSFKKRTEGMGVDRLVLKPGQSTRLSRQPTEERRP